MEKITGTEQAKQNLNTDQPKRGRGRPRKPVIPKIKRERPKKPPTFTKGFRLTQEMMDFFSTLKNQNAFFVAQVEKSKEFQEFIANQEDKNTAPKLPYFN